MLLRSISAEATQDRRIRGRPRHDVRTGATESLASNTGLPSQESLTTENTILRRLLVDALVELERFRAGTNVTRKKLRNGQQMGNTDTGKNGD
jgi:hypothetical protein